ncbi:MAG TPA: cytochrome c biogenesis protein ResB [Gammaproteobacteria bacterium]
MAAQPTPELSGRSSLLRRLASLRITLGLLLLLMLFVIHFLVDSDARGALLALPLGLLALNLVAAIFTHPAMRTHPALLTFHLALLVLLLLVAVGRLTQFTGKVEVTVGEGFNAALVTRQGGPWHNDRLEQVEFHLNSFTIDYTPNQGMAQRDATRAMVHWRDRRGNEHEGVVGDHRPLVLNGYRFYTTHNKGFAPVFVWTPNSGVPQQGSVHLPAWPAHDHTQALDWNLPGTSHQLWTQLQFDEEILDSQHPSQFRPPKEHLLVMRAGEQRYELRPGQSIDFADGRLTYKELRTWMGFAVFNDWTLPWLFAAGIMLVLSLGWHYWRKCAARPWLMADAAPTAGDRGSV